MKKTILFYVFVVYSITGSCQLVSSDVNFANNTSLIGIPPPNLTYNNASFATNGFHSAHGRGGSLNASGVFDMLSNKFNISVPTKYRYKVKGVDFQAGLLTNSRQPKLGAGFSSRNGFNFSAGYGVGMPNLGKLGYSPLNSKNQGIQFTAGYRLFGRKR